jgi:hypothetical protein
MLFRLVNLRESPQDMIRSAEIAHPSIAMEAARLKMPGNPSIDDLKQRLQGKREEWIKQNKQDWLNKNQFYPGIVELLRELSHNRISGDASSTMAAGDVIIPYICSTKHKSLIKELLHHMPGVSIPDEHIFGLGSGKKVDIIAQIGKSQSNVKRIIFVEDRLEALIDTNRGPTPCKLVLAGYGYNTDKERKRAEEEFGFPVCSSVAEIRQFIVGGNNSSNQQNILVGENSDGKSKL